MKKIFVINGGQHFAHSGGKFNKTLTELDISFYTKENGFELEVTDINEPYDLDQEVQKFVWADVVAYHTPVWWFGLPYKLKEYIDLVFTAGHRKGIYRSDGRKTDNPAINYGTGGMLHGRKYMLSTTWNAPETAFTLPGEFFHQTSVDDGPLFGFHRMNAFTGMEPLPSIHFHDLEKNVTEEQITDYKNRYLEHLKHIFQEKEITE
ncbi:NAD(P)H-dependent oxidoreductase [Olivibacter sitiensis]|uniref:NAD(P)H-dependent oxidoreductase n=1 Tax=Olivibacter sitiensis TaxID=376470 RepID=UPI0003F6E9A5|nr:NAD(P)H-dependent oxidoreductase [Olivibacter sitiensis]